MSSLLTARAVRVVGVLALAAVLASTAAPTSLAQDEEVTFVDLDRGNPGDTARLIGAVGTHCVPGTAEVGLRAEMWDWDDHFEDPRTGEETVLLRPDVAPGSRFEEEVVLPDLGRDDVYLYIVCAADYEGGGPRGYPGQISTWQYGDAWDQPPMPSPDEPEPDANRPPIAVADAYATPAGQRLEVEAPGILANDHDPDGDPIIAIVTGVRTTVQGELRVRPDGSLEFTPETSDSGALCVEYVARDDQRAISEPAPVVIGVGDGDVAEVTGDGGCDIEYGDDEFEVWTELGDDEIDEQVFDLAGPWGDDLDGGWLLALDDGWAVPWDDAQAQQVQWHGYGAAHFHCDQIVRRRGVYDYWYGQMRAPIWARRGSSDYIRTQHRYLRNGQLIAHSPVRMRQFPRHFGQYGWVSTGSSLRFGTPGAVYTVQYRIQWWEDRFPPNIWFNNGTWTADRLRWRDQVLADTGWRAIPRSCRAHPDLGANPW